MPGRPATSLEFPGTPVERAPCSRLAGEPAANAPRGESTKSSRNEPMPSSHHVPYAAALSGPRSGRASPPACCRVRQACRSAPIPFGCARRDRPRAPGPPVCCGRRRNARHLPDGQDVTQRRCCSAREATVEPHGVANPAGQPYGYNLSFRDVLPRGRRRTCPARVPAPATASSRRSLANEPADRLRPRLIWRNLGDLSPELEQPPLTYQVGARRPSGAERLRRRRRLHAIRPSAYINTDRARPCPRSTRRGRRTSVGATGSATAGTETTR